MNRYERLEKLLQVAFAQASFQLFDDSEEHAGHGHGFDGETHYRLRITDAAFAGMQPLAAHRKILAAVKDETDAGMHSFVIEKATAPEL